MAEFKLEGLKELEQKLQELGKKASRIENKALRKAGEYLSDEMKKEVPVSTVEHKHIRDDIKVSRVKSKDGQKYVEVGPGEDTNWRAKFLEFGTVKMQANPFMSRTYEKNKEKLQDIIKNELMKGLGL